MAQDIFTRKERFWGNVVYSILWLLGQLPSFIHYAFADFLAFIIRKVIPYRVDVVKTNLRNSFPDKDEKEINQLTKRYYRHMGDLGVEYLMMAGFSRKRFLRHIKLEHAEVLHDLYSSGVPNTFLVLGHFGNWEWYTGLQTLLMDTQFYVLYQKQQGIWNYVFYRIRSKFGSRLLDKDTAPREIVGMRKDKSSKTFIFVADQIPSTQGIHLFIPFLNQNTATFTGMERLARALKAPVVYVSSRQKHRGHYTVDLQLICNDASTYAENDLTIDFMRRLERDILFQPEQWLWSHRRWKYNIEEIRAWNPTHEIVQR